MDSCPVSKVLTWKGDEKKEDWGNFPTAADILYFLLQVHTLSPLPPPICLYILIPYPLASAQKGHQQEITRKEGSEVTGGVLPAPSLLGHPELTLPKGHSFNQPFLQHRLLVPLAGSPFPTNLHLLEWIPLMIPSLGWSQFWTITISEIWQQPLWFPYTQHTPGGRDVLPISTHENMRVWTELNLAELRNVSLQVPAHLWSEVATEPVVRQGFPEKMMLDLTSELGQVQIRCGKEVMERARSSSDREVNAMALLYFSSSHQMTLEGLRLFPIWLFNYYGEHTTSF